MQTRFGTATAFPTTTLFSLSQLCLVLNGLVDRYFCNHISVMVVANVVVNILTLTSI